MGVASPVEKQLMLKKKVPDEPQRVITPSSFKLSPLKSAVLLPDILGLGENEKFRFLLENERRTWGGEEVDGRPFRLAEGKSSSKDAHRYFGAREKLHA